MLQGRVPGLTVLSVSGEPGANNIVDVRGSIRVDPNSVSAPLYVIDGIVFDLNNVQSAYGNSNHLSVINPNDIETIDVLKDASASAICGAKAANGFYVLYKDDGISQDYLKEKGTWNRMVWDDTSKQLTIQPGAPKGFANQVIDRTFKVELIPQGITQNVNYSRKFTKILF